MNKQDREEYRQRYVERLNQFGHAPQTLGWRPGTQFIRYSALTQDVPLDQINSVLDVGCGFGDLSLFLRQRGFTGRYLGIDIVPELIMTAKIAYEHEHFEACSISEMSNSDTFDLVIASGIFNARLKHVIQWKHITDMLTHMLQRSHRVVASDFLTSYVDFRQDDLFYTSPEDVFRFAKSLTKRVTLRHDYLPFEFAIALFRQDQLWNQRFFEDGVRPQDLIPPETHGDKTPRS